MHGEAALIAYVAANTHSAKAQPALGVCIGLYLSAHPSIQFLLNHQFISIDHTPQIAQHFISIHFGGLRPQNKGGGPN